LVLTALLLARSAWADPAATGDALDRLEEVLALRMDEGSFRRDEVLPALVVSVEPRYTASETWFSARALEVLGRAFGLSGLRLCEACMAPRTWVRDGNLEYQTGAIGLDELVRLDEATRGDALPARSAIWLDEHRGGVGVRIVDLATGRVIFAQNVDPLLVENANTHRMGALTEELERRARGDSLTQTFVDAAVYPRQHISLDFTDQWGKTNANLSGVTISLLDPVVGLGFAHYRRLPLLNLLVGAKAIVSLPTAVSASLGGGDEVIDPLLTAVGVVRVPFGRSNYGVVATASTNGAIGVGLSLMNIRILPVLP
jgi:hypothetical protein